jgi:hypothetical protein
MKMIFLLMLLLPYLANADDVSLYKFYANDGHFIAYLKKNDPCVYAGYIKEGDIHRYCEMGDSGINLEKNNPTAYATNFTFKGASIHFIMAAPWNEQECTISMSRKKITCKPTGK